jgi:hypothetical protein
MSDFDDVIQSGRRQLERLNAQMAQANAQYQQCRIEGDQDGMDIALQDWSNLENQAVNLQNSYNRQIAAQQAAAPRELSAEEKAARPLSHMNYGDVYDMLKHSKYGVDDNAFRAGIAEVQRRRARGE